MTTYQELKKNHAEATQKLLTSSGVFWAFSDEQFAEGKAGIPEGTKLVSIGMGGYMPKDTYQEMSAALKKLDSDYKKAVKAAKAQAQAVKYEISNHEGFEAALDILANLGITKEQAKKLS